MDTNKLYDGDIVVIVDRSYFSDHVQNGAPARVVNRKTGELEVISEGGRVLTQWCPLDKTASHLQKVWEAPRPSPTVTIEVEGKSIQISRESAIALKLVDK